MFKISETTIHQVFEIEMPCFKDLRGSFTKIFQDSIFLKAGISFSLKESYFSVSEKEVIRGMHFQLPPHQHHKIVFCPHGKVQDVAVDLRKKSPTFGQFYSTFLSAGNHKALFIPEGCAHGFKSIEDKSMTFYFVSSEYNQEADSGILWNSFGMDWQCEKPLLSERDRSFPPFSAFESPF